MLDPGPHTLFADDRESEGLSLRWLVGAFVVAVIVVGSYYVYRDMVRVQRHEQEIVWLKKYLAAADAMESSDQDLWRRLDEAMHAEKTAPISGADLDLLRDSVQAFYAELDPFGAPVSLRTYIRFQRGRCEALLRMLEDLAGATDPQEKRVQADHPSLTEWRTRYRLLERMHLRENKGIAEILRRQMQVAGMRNSRYLNRALEEADAFNPSVMPLQEQPKALLIPVDEPIGK